MGDFSHSCQHPQYDPQSTELHAECRTYGFFGTYQPTTLLLDQYIGNINGRLMFVSYRFSATCKNCRLGGEGNILQCYCETENGDWISTELALDERIENNDGHLKFK
ncbi:CVNH domain-containing protein [Roseiarcus fermentans]|uniref:mannose-binding lectin n=1 Tax=Roseiarcus fermentans TaxID=1473586 RepID=UPI000DE8BD32